MTIRKFEPFMKISGLTYLTDLSLKNEKEKGYKFFTKFFNKEGI